MPTAMRSTGEPSGALIVAMSTAASLVWTLSGTPPSVACVP